MVRPKFHRNCGDQLVRINRGGFIRGGGVCGGRDGWGGAPGPMGEKGDVTKSKAYTLKHQKRKGNRGGGGQIKLNEGGGLRGPAGRGKSLGLTDWGDKRYPPPGTTANGTPQTKNFLV